MAISDGRFINLEFQGLFLHGFSHQKKRGSGPHLSFTVISAAKDLTDRQTTDICHDDDAVQLQIAIYVRADSRSEFARRT